MGVTLLELGKTHLQKQERVSEHLQGGGCSACLEPSSSSSSHTLCPIPAQGWCPQVNGGSFLVPQRAEQIWGQGARNKLRDACW